jgi:replicative DNA helicase
VWFVWRERNKENVAQSESEFITAKNRHGATGIHHLLFQSQNVRFVERTEGP